MVDSRAWSPSNATLLLSYVVSRGSNRRRYTDRDHLVAAARWLAKAQDANSDGGLSGRCRLGAGWTSSYPETTGYLIPTLLDLCELAGLAEFRDRAKRAVEFLLRVQLPSGAFPGAEIAENTSEPSVFNSAQIICGLTAWHRATGDALALNAAFRAADWILKVQDTDGAFRAHVYNSVACTYMAHATCWIAELGNLQGIARYRESTRRHVTWVLTHVDHSTGWFDLAGFDSAQHKARHAYTHTIAYTLWGVLLSCEILREDAGIAAVEKAAWAIARRLELAGRLPGLLNSQWHSSVGYSCVTGTAQMALVWFRLYERGGDIRFANAALKAIDMIKESQPMTRGPENVRGAIPGSDPPWGDYIHLAYPNWAAKFFIDALFAKQRALGHARAPRRTRSTPPASIGPELLPAPSTAAGVISRPRIVLLSSTGSLKVAQFLSIWGDWGFAPVAVIAERPARSDALTRLKARLLEDGPSQLARAALRRVLPGRDRQAPVAPLPGDWRTICAQRGVAVHVVASVNSPEAIELIRALRPHLAIHAGAGLLRADVLRLPVLGTLNAHMGLLPQYRGMNVAEWAVIMGEQPGCSVHVIDTGIDTGPIIARRSVDTAKSHSIEDLRAAIDAAQVQLLGEVVRAVWQQPSSKLREFPQTLAEGKQFFRMHEELRAILTERLTATSTL